MTSVFLDFEFTSLSQAAIPISMGLIAENGNTFYAEFSGVKTDLLTDWLKEYVVPQLRFEHIYESAPVLDFEHHAMKADKQKVAFALQAWLAQFEQVHMWGDCLAYDWMLFCELWGGAERLPANVFYIPFDLATYLMVKGLDPDVSREEYAGLAGKKHNALWDAKVMRAIYFKLLGITA